MQPRIAAGMIESALRRQLERRNLGAALGANHDRLRAETAVDESRAWASETASAM
jgi:hypothetical protein